MVNGSLARALEADAGPAFASISPVRSSTDLPLLARSSNGEPGLRRTPSEAFARRSSQSPNDGSLKSLAAYVEFPKYDEAASPAERRPAVDVDGSATTGLKSPHPA